MNVPTSKNKRRFQEDTEASPAKKAHQDTSRHTTVSSTVASAYQTEAEKGTIKNRIK